MYTYHLLVGTGSPEGDNILQVLCFISPSERYLMCCLCDVTGHVVGNLLKKNGRMTHRPPALECLEIWCQTTVPRFCMMPGAA